MTRHAWPYMHGGLLTVGETDQSETCSRPCSVVPRTAAGSRPPDTKEFARMPPSNSEYLPPLIGSVRKDICTETGWAIRCPSERDSVMPQVIPPCPFLVHTFWAVSRPFFPCFSRSLRVSTVSTRRFQRVPSRNPGPRNIRQGDQERRPPPFVRHPRC